MSHPMRILRIDSSAKSETSESRRLTDRIIDGLQANANATVDALIKQL